MRLIIISNRLPIKVQRNNDSYSFTKSEGGVATGLESLESNIEKVWIGWPGIDVKYEQDRQLITKIFKRYKYHPVFLNKRQIKEYYDGYCNSKLWPLCHYFYAFIKHEESFWTAYKEVNELFCKEALKIIKKGDIVWVQDYHLMLLPRMIRQERKDIAIGYFHHIPFPSYELFRVLRERADLLKGLLGCDLIGFHTHDYMRHFISACERGLELDFDLDIVNFDKRQVHIDSFPMGINYNKFNDAVLSPKVQGFIEGYRNLFGSSKLILSVDRLDYSKGILNRLKGFELFLKNNPQYQGNVSLTMILVPSRDTVSSYAELKAKVDEMIGGINGQFSKISWTPVNYMYKSFDFEELVALYHLADIALVTPLRDGMNLVAKEYVAAKRDSPGVLILSEMAGASIELMDSIIINPNSLMEIESALIEALEMPVNEQLKRLKRMQAIISKQTVQKWAGDFMDELIRINSNNNIGNDKLLNVDKIKSIKNRYKKAKKRLLLLDYDGTLVGFMSRPEDAKPDEDLIILLKLLSQDQKNKVVISSGRDHSVLNDWFGELNIGLAAEHGAFYKEDGKWYENVHHVKWNEEIMDIFQKVTDKTPRSQLEVKQTALVWHFRRVDPWLASIRTQQLVSTLLAPCIRQDLHIMRGSKIIEVKYADCSKGSEVKRLLSKSTYDFILAIGDDTTDEDMFNALSEDSVSIKIGNVSNAANFNISNQSDAITLLKNLVGLKM